MKAYFQRQILIWGKDFGTKILMEWHKFTHSDADMFLVAEDKLALKS